MQEKKVMEGNDNKKYVIKGFARFFGIAILSAVCVLLMVGLAYLDISNAGIIRDASYTENMQETLLFSSSVIFIYLAKKNNMKGLLLVAGFFACMWIREWDAVFDEVFHGAWKYVAIPTAIAFTFMGLRDGLNKAFDDLADFMKSKGYDLVALGLIIVLVVSRILGTKALWMLMSGVDFKYVFKTFIEEGVELIGYMTIFAGSVHYYLSSRK